MGRSVVIFSSIPKSNFWRVFDVFFDQVILAYFDVFTIDCYAVKCVICIYFCNYTPVFRRDVLWYGDVRPSGSPSVRPSQFSALFSYMLWDIELKFCISLYYDERKSKFECHQFPSIFIRPSSDGTYYGMVMSIRPSGSPSVRPSVRHSFPHFSPTCFEILSWNFVYHFILMHVRSSSNVINFRQFLLELRPFWTSNSYQYAVFRTFLLHALTYWAQILHMTLFHRTTDQVRVPSICVNVCGSYAPFGT